MRIATVIAAGLAVVGGMIGWSNTARAQVVIRCAREGQGCYVPKATPVLFGRDGATIIKSFTSSRTIACDVAGFGRNPLVGRDKICILLLNPAAHAWRFCANGGVSQVCVVPLGQGLVVRFGDPASNRWVYRSFPPPPPGGVPCDASIFGGDPAPGVLKRCELTQ